MSPSRKRAAGRLVRAALCAGCVLALFPPGARGYDLLAWAKARLGPEVPPLPSSEGTFRVEVLAEGLESPWAVVPLPDGRIFVTERPGRLRVVQGGRLEAQAVPGVPAVAVRGQGGLLDLTPHPDYPRTRRLFLAYTAEGPGEMRTQVASFEEGEGGLRGMKIVFAGVPGGDRPKHFGSRIRFGPDGKLYITLGERGEGRRAQDLLDLNGKTLRLNEDGSIPAENPFADREGARPEIFSYGHRNSQGMAVHPETGRIFQTEHGPSWNDAPGGGDEVNLLVAGGNYGWPLVHHRERRVGTLAPLVEYTPALAPAGCTFVRGEAFPHWRGDFLFAALVGRRLVRLRVEGTRPVGEEHLLVDRFGRLRDVACGPDGTVYAITSDTDAYGPGRAGGDRLLRLVPAR